MRGGIRATRTARIALTLCRQRHTWQRHFTHLSRPSPERPLLLVVRMGWAALGRTLWFASFLAMMSVGCGRSWPTVNGLADPDFAAHRVPVHSVDVLPLDVDLAIGAATRATPLQIAERFNAVALATLKQELVNRGYRVTAVAWSGDRVYQEPEPTYPVYDQQDVVDTADSLRGYGYAQSKSGQSELLTPHLPTTLGGGTGSDTTLYVGGWAYVGKTKTSTGKKVAIGVVIGLVLVVVIVAAVAGSKGKGGGGFGRAAGAAARGAGKAASTVVRGAARAGGKVARGAGRAAGHVAKGAGRAAGEIGRGMGRAAGQVARGGGRAAGNLARATARTGIRVVDAMGHSNTHIDIYGGDVHAYQRDIPRDGYSRMHIELTLVDNRTGRTLWHARQRFYASAASPADTQEVMRRMVASLPRR